MTKELEKRTGRNPFTPVLLSYPVADGSSPELFEANYMTGDTTIEEYCLLRNGVVGQDLYYLCNPKYNKYSF